MHTCGHQGKIRYRGRYHNRPVHPDLTKPCPACRKAGRARAIKALRKNLAELRNELPPITGGSPKQNAWAEKIRSEVFADPTREGAEEFTVIGQLAIWGQPDGTVNYESSDSLAELERGIPQGPVTPSQARQLIRTQLTTTSAIWWIENR